MSLEKHKSLYSFDENEDINEDINAEDSERERIQKLLQNFESEEVSFERNDDSKLDEFPRFILNINNVNNIKFEEKSGYSTSVSMPNTSTEGNAIKDSLEDINYSSLVDYYIKTTKESSLEDKIKHFLIDKDGNDAQTKVIDNVAYINRAASAQIYNAVMDEVNKGGNFDLNSVKNRLELVCLTSIDCEYVEMSLKVLKDVNICSNSEFMDIVSKTIQKEKKLNEKIKKYVI